MRSLETFRFATLCVCSALTAAAAPVPSPAPSPDAPVSAQPAASPAVAPGAAAATAFDSLPRPGHAIVVAEQAIVHDKPDVLANALRLLYGGEVVEVLEVVRDQDQALWARISMGRAEGYVRHSDLRMGESAGIREWKRPVVLRDDRPLSFSLKLGGEMFGGGMNIHYLPFSRLGMSFSVGSIVDGSEMKGTALSLGLLSYLALHDISPFVETGFTRLSYHEQQAILRVESYYLSLGVEWIFSNGVFINAMVTYSRSADVEISYDYDKAKSGNLQVPPDFGVLDPGDDATFQFVLPGISLGYAF